VGDDAEVANMFQFSHAKPEDLLSDVIPRI